MVERSAWYPSVDLEMRKRFAHQNTLRSTIELERSSQIGVSLDIPLGGRTQARVNEARAREQQALAQIESDRMVVRSSYGDIARQLAEIRTIAPYIQQRVEASAELVRAYGLQFEAGRRSVVELVNAQRERFNAQLALLDNVNQQFALQARLLNLSGQLNADLHKLYYDESPGAVLALFKPSNIFRGDGPAVATELGDGKPPPDVSASKGTTPQEGVAVDAAKVKPAAAVASDEVLSLLQAWAKAWSAKDYARYRGYYAEFFRGDGYRNTTDWETVRRKRLNKPGDITIMLDALNARPLNEKDVIVDFVQRYQSADHSDMTKKQMLWRRTEGSWKIVRESTVTP
jgi:outer membrane protein, adhesin transport system